MSTRRSLRRAVPLLTAAALACVLAACGSSGGGTSVSADATSTAGATGTLRLAYFPNLTHAPALYALNKGIFTKDLGSGVTLKTSSFNSGTQEAEAVLSGAVDIGYSGPNPAINTFVKSHGDAIRVISGVTSGGAALVVKPSITTVAELKGKKIATPSLGNTQDVALRYFLDQHGLKTTTSSGGAVTITPQDNATTLTAFQSGALDGAWVPEPYVSRLVAAGGHILVNEATLWPQGKFVTTLLLVRTAYLNEHPGIVRNLLKANLDSIDALNADPAAGQTAVNAELKKETGKALTESVLTSAWKSLTFTPDPIASSLTTSAAHAKSLGLLSDDNLNGIFDLGPVNSLLSAAGKSTVAS